MKTNGICLCSILFAVFVSSAVAVPKQPASENVKVHTVSVKSGDLKEGTNHVKTVAGYHLSAVVTGGKIASWVVTDPNGNPVKVQNRAEVVTTKCWHCVEVIVDGESRGQMCWTVPCGTIRNPGGPKTN